MMRAFHGGNHKPAQEFLPCLGRPVRLRRGARQKYRAEQQWRQPTWTYLHVH
jgi:hypothetical protein